MVVALGPGKFYGSSLPRPRIYNDVKFNDERVDPPVPVLDPLLSWANEAHWSMGGLSFKRLRLQGKIEGNVQKLKKEKEKIEKNSNQSLTPMSDSKKKSSTNGGNKGKKRGNREESPPPAPISKKAQRRSMLVDEDDNDDDDAGKESENEGIRRKRRRLVRKLGDDFEMVATENGISQGGRSEGVASRTRSRRSIVLAEDEESEDGEKTESGKYGNGSKAEKISERKGSVSPKSVTEKNGEKDSASSNGTRSSPRLKQKSS